MPVTLDFRTLTLQDALDLAILVEDEAKERYEELAAQMEGHHTSGAAEFFKFMIVNEKKHGDDLRERRKKLFGNAPAKVNESMIFDVEAPAYEEVRAFMTPREAYGVALRAEEKAFAFFNEALASLPDGEVSKLLAELRDEEIEHQELVKKQIAALPPDPIESQADLADEPTGQ